MTRGVRLACALAAAHLAVVAAGAAGLLAELGDSAAARAVRWYAAVTGADAGFSYFAPRVGSEMRVRFVLSDGQGRRWEDELAAGRNQEARLRVGSMTGLFPPDPEAEALRHDLTASWAAAMFARHPEAARVAVLVEVHEVPSMADYRAGHRPYWALVYAATFALGGEAAP